MPTLSPLFAGDAYKLIEKAVLAHLQDHADFLGTQTANSPRAVGDAIQTLLADSFEQLAGAGVLNYSAGFARRAMADLAFYDAAGFYYVVDVKTHREDTHFNMPNLVSVDRLARFYEDDKNYFVLLKVVYTIDGNRFVPSKVTFVPIEFLSWECLTIGALGWGQIQIANSNRIVLNEHQDRREWMLQLCDTMLVFYPKEITRIDIRTRRFVTLREQWQNRSWPPTSLAA